MQEGWILRSPQSYPTVYVSLTPSDLLPSLTVSLSSCRLLQSVKNEVAGDPIHYRSVQCDGTETELSDCSFSDFTDNCDDVAVTCKSGEHYVSGRHYVSILPISHTDTATSGFTNDDVRLLGSRDDGKGVLEYYDRFYGWTGVCADSSTEWLDATAAATIVCRQLGYEGGTTYTEGYDRNILLIKSSPPFPSSCIQRQQCCQCLRVTHCYRLVM